MRSSRPESPLSEGARELKNATRILLVVAVLLLGGALAALKHWIPVELGPPFVGLFAAAALSTIWIGTKAHQRALEDREKEGGRFMIVAIAAQLSKQDDEALERIKAKGGPAGEAAGMILMGRAEKRAGGRRPEAGAPQENSIRRPAP
jgi:hypothetical protein